MHFLHGVLHGNIIQIKDEISPLGGGAHVALVVERDVAAVLAARVHHVRFVEHVELHVVKEQLTLWFSLGYLSFKLVNCDFNENCSTLPDGKRRSP